MQKMICVPGFASANGQKGLISATLTLSIDNKLDRFAQILLEIVAAYAKSIVQKFVRWLVSECARERGKREREIRCKAQT